MTPALPKINLISNDPEKFQWFEDGSKFLVALQVVNHKTNTTQWEFAVVITEYDGEGMLLRWPEGEYYSDWEWTDFEYFHLMEGAMPTGNPDDE